VMVDATTPLLWCLAAVSACLGLLVTTVSSPHQAVPSSPLIPWWQGKTAAHGLLCCGRLLGATFRLSSRAEVAARYGLADDAQATSAYPVDDCLTVAIHGYAHTVAYHTSLHVNPTFYSLALNQLSGGASTPLNANAMQVTILQVLPPELFVDPYEVEQTAAHGLDCILPPSTASARRPSPACRATVLGLTLWNMTQRPGKQGSRPTYHTFDIPFHTKYPAPSHGSAACSSDVFAWHAGPSYRVRWPPPLLLIRYPQHVADDSSLGVAEEGRLIDSPDSDASDPAPSEALGGDAAPAGRSRHEHGKARQQPPASSAQPWSIMHVSLAVEEAIMVPAGCMLHARVVGGITLLMAVVCSSVLVAAALC
ncbi:hypothetical protein TSOC_008790, partial [Tetrabaena socialis]